MQNIEEITKKLPNNYLKIFTIVVNKILGIYDNELVDIMLAGSGGKGLIIYNWSDLDIYIIVNKYDISKNNILHKYLQTIKEIHVGETVYSKNHFLEKMVDDKTLVSMYENRLGYNPLLFNNITIPSVSKIELFRMYEYKKYVLFQTVERAFLDYQNDIISLNSLIKKLTILIKCYLLLKYNLFTTGYQEVFFTFFNILNKDNSFEFSSFIKQNNNLIIEKISFILVTINNEI